MLISLKWFTLMQENDFRMVQGYRMVDLNVMRMAMKTAQQCRHAALILTEVNAGCAQVKKLL